MSIIDKLDILKLKKDHNRYYLSRSKSCYVELLKGSLEYHVVVLVSGNLIKLHVYPKMSDDYLIEVLSLIIPNVINYCNHQNFKYLEYIVNENGVHTKDSNLEVLSCKIVRHLHDLTESSYIGVLELIDSYMIKSLKFGQYLEYDPLSVSDDKLKILLNKGVIILNNEVNYG